MRGVLVVRVGTTVAYLIQVNGKLGSVERLPFPQVFSRIDDFVPGMQCHNQLPCARFGFRAYLQSAKMSCHRADRAHCFVDKAVISAFIAPEKNPNTR